MKVGQKPPFINSELAFNVAYIVVEMKGDC